MVLLPAGIPILCVAAIAYLPLMAAGSVNSDGLWAGAGRELFVSGKWEQSLGRWAWAPLLRLRDGAATPACIVAMTLLLLTVGVILLVRLTGMRSICALIISGLLIVLSPKPADSLTYFPYAAIYEWTFLLAVALVVFVEKPRTSASGTVAGVTLGGVCLVTSHRLYQSSLGDALVTVVSRKTLL